MRALTATVAAVAVALAACKDKPAGTPAVGPAAADKGGTTVRPSPRPDPAAPIVAQATAFLATWTDTQKKLDFAAYAALYEPRTFRGVKRTTGGKLTEYDFAGWSRDRQRMFAKKFEVATELLGVDTWLDEGSKLKRDMVVIRFLQRWRAGAYADHGVKVLHVWRDPKGAMKITYEDLLNSEPGWERVAADVPTADLAPPADPAAALALWTKLAPTAADYDDKLASIPEDPAVSRPMALALLSAGNFACEKILEADECGVVTRAWEDLDPKADLDDPCLRRRLALWALAKIEPTDTPALEAQLAAMARLELPEDELPQAALAAVAGAPEPVRLAVWDGLVDSGREELITVDADLSEKSLLEAAVDIGLDDAALALDPVRHMEVIAGLLGAKGLADDTRSTLLDRVADHDHPAITKALVALTSDENCSLAMDAALALERQKDASHMPQRGGGERALCLLMHDPNESRRAAIVATFIPRNGILVQETIEDPWAEMERGDAGAEPEEEPEPIRVQAVDEVITRLQEIFDETGAWETAKVNMGSDDKGGEVIESFEYYRYNGCGC